MYRLDSADKQTLAIIGIWSAAVFFAVVGLALVLAVAVRLFFTVSGL
jgi:hypothetical protein